MSDETAIALESVVQKAMGLHETANDPQEDRCEELADWIIKTFLPEPVNA